MRHSISFNAIAAKLARFAFVLGVLLVGMVPRPSFGQSNPIIIENQLPGTGAWEIQWGEAGDDVNGQVKGYASAASVNKGESITFHVSVKPAQTFTIDVYRMGWYQGLGGRLVQRIGPLNGTLQPTCPTDPTTGLIECAWAPSYTLQTSTGWTSGVYLAVLTNAQNFKNYVSFVLRDDGRQAPLLYQQPVTTYQAYNDYPYDQRTGKSLYSFNSYGATTVGGSRAAVKVSFDRPYNGDGDANIWGHNVLGPEMAFIRWLERSGYDVAYTTDIDTHVAGSRLLSYRGFIMPGHDEYWTKEMYDAVVAARDGGVHLGFFSANIAYTQIRLEPSSSGAPNRVVVCYRDAALDPVADSTRKTVNWREAPLNRPEQALVGVQYTNQVAQNAQGFYAPYVVTNSGHWVYAGTGLVDGSSVTGLVGYEADRLFSEFSQPSAVAGSYTLLSRSPFSASGGSDYGNSSIYQAPSGAWVFGAGTINWGYALDSFNLGSPSIVDARIQRMTANVLDRFVAGNTGGEASFTLSAVPATQTVNPGNATSYNVTVNPVNGFNSAVTLSASGLPSATTAAFSPNPTTATSTLAIATSPSTPVGSNTLTITGVAGALTRTTAAALVVSVPDFTLSSSPSTRSVVQGASTTFNLSVNPTGGFTGSVTLSASGLPSDAIVTFTPNPTAGTSVMNIATTPATAPGTYPFVITGVSGALTRAASGTLTITNAGINVTAPNTAVSWKATSIQSITFTHTLGVGAVVNLDVSRDSGATWSRIAALTTTSATSGSYSWTVTGPATTQARIRASSAVNPNLADQSDVDFTVVNPTITVSAPNTAVKWRAGDSKSITFSHTMGVGQQVGIDLSRDGGVTWSTIGSMTTTSATSGTYPWIVVGPPTTTARIRVSWLADAAVNDISNVDFTILPRTTVTAPNTAVSWGAESTRKITWSHNLGLGGLVDIDFSSDNGATWSRLASAVACDAATTGSYTTQMPSVTTTQGRIRVSPIGDTSLGDVSDAAFTLAEPKVTVTAPNTAVTWGIGTTQSIKWSHNLGTLESVTIELARDGLNFTEVIASPVVNSAATSGTYAWVVTGSVTSAAKVRVSWPRNAAVTDVSNVNFKIQ